MQKLVLSVPDELYARVRTSFPDGQRSKIFIRLIEAELARKDEALYQAALALENNAEAAQEVKEWEEAFGNDGLENVIWEPEVEVKRIVK